MHRALNSAIAIIVLSLTVIAAPSSGLAKEKYNEYGKPSQINSNIEVSDPIEPVNRAIYGFNRFLDKIILKPVAKTYRFIVPEKGRKGVTNALRNLTEPVNFLNSVLQGDVNQSFTSFWRFTINSTMGIGGLFDVARLSGLEYRKEDFGQTAGTYGTGTGPFLMLPILGPSNARDTAGLVVDSFTNPFNYLHDDFVIAHAVIKGIDSRERTLDLVDEIDRISLDPYAATRSLYTQKRADDIRNGR